MTLGELFERNAALFGRKIAIVGDGGAHVTHAELASRGRRLANALQGRGVGRQARIAILGQNSPAYVETIAGAAMGDFICANLSWRLAVHEIADVVRDCEPDVLIFDARQAPAAAELRAGGINPAHWIHLGDGPDWAAAFDDLAAEGSDRWPDRCAGADCPASLVYTSGTTGRARGVLHTHRSLLEAARGIAWEGEVRRDDRLLLVMPLFHVGGTIEYLAFACMGATTFVQAAFDAPRALAVMVRDGITAAHLAPTMIGALLEVPGFGAHDVSSVRIIHYGSAPMAPSLLRRAISAFGCIFTQIYGMSECINGAILPALSHVSGDTGSKVGRLASAGQSFFGGDIRIVRDNGEECRTGEAGEILIRGPSLMQGYWRDPAATSAVLRDGWMHSGDIGQLDEERFLFVLDRKKDMIISGGENIYSPEVEDALLSHEAVAEVAVIGVPDPHWGEAVHAIVVLREGAEVSVEALIAHCRKRAASYKKPRHISFVSGLPRLGSGKLDKKMLRAKYRHMQCTEGA